jgi:aspartyl-tRNA(Asn)/glutamyl-tRNA(Gln) amidotransferase subunit C
VSLTDDEVRKLALLARLELSEQEVAMVRPQLDSILGFVERLSELDTADV